MPVASTRHGSCQAGGAVSQSLPKPGHYLLFVLDSNGTPSVGQAVHISASTCVAEPQLTNTYAITPDGCAYTATVTVSGANLGTDYRWTINGAPDTTFTGNASASVELNSCQPQATFGVRVTPSCGGTPVENFVSVSRGFSPRGCPCESL